MSEAEVMLFRLPTKGWFFNAFADFADTRYFDVPSVKSEQVGVTGLQLSKAFHNGWNSTFGVTGLYQNQVLDYADAYTNQNSIGQIVGTTLAPRWSVRKTWAALWVEAEISGTRQWFDAPLDSYWAYGPRLALGHGWGQGSEISLSYQFSRLDYDGRPQVTAAGASIPDTLLALNVHAAELSLTHFWDAKQRWQTLSGVGVAANFDNGAGYYDYANGHISQRVRYRDEQWEVSLQAKLNFYGYLNQSVSATDLEKRQRTLMNLGLRAERKLTKHFLVHVSYLFDRSFSNQEFEDYLANTFMAGIGLTI